MYQTKQTNFDTLNYQQIKEIEHQINSRPRKKSGFYSPKEIFLPKFAILNSCIMWLKLSFTEKNLFLFLENILYFCSV
jgi:hypothetical protein